MNLSSYLSWNILVMSGLVLLNCHMHKLAKLQKRVLRSIVSTFAVSLGLLVHYRNGISLSFIYRYYLGRCSSELAKLVPYLYSHWRSTRYTNRLHHFLSPFLDVIRMAMPKISFFAQLDS